MFLSDAYSKSVSLAPHLLLLMGDAGDREGQLLLADGGSSSSSEELSMVKSITSTFLCLLDWWWEDTWWSTEELKQPRKKQAKRSSPHSQAQRGSRRNEQREVGSVKRSYQRRKIVSQNRWRDKTGGYAYSRQLTFHSIERCRHLLCLFFGSHRSPWAVLLELDFITICAKLQDFHKQPRRQRASLENVLRARNLHITWNSSVSQCDAAIRTLWIRNREDLDSNPRLGHKTHWVTVGQPSSLRLICHTWVL